MAVANTLVESFGKTPSPQIQTAPPPAAPQPLTFGDPDAYVTGKDLQAAATRATEQFGSGVQAATNLAADANYRMVQREYQKEFSKYGPEITTMLSNVPRNMWTIDNLERVVKIVRADHFDDYRAEWQADVASKMDPTMRSNGGAGSAPVSQADKSLSLESEKIPAEWKLRAQQQGLTEATIEEFCRANEMPRIEFYKQFETPMNAIVGDRGGR